MIMPRDPSESDDRVAVGGGRFCTTRWSLVALASRDHSQEASAALNELCCAYWKPIYAEIRRRGHSTADAQDLTQEFFARLLRGSAFGRADREKGRFRSYLLAALDFFLADTRRGKMAEKRGGGATVFSLDADEGEDWYAQQPAQGSTPAEAFDRRWALVLMDRALTALRHEYCAGGRGDVFLAVQPFLAAESGAGGYGAAGEKLGMTGETFTVAVHRLRRRFRVCVREQVEMTVVDPAETDSEMRHLFGM
jgi:RNA polymerase sigma-70 factor (ECF subfamily)